MSALVPARVGLDLDGVLIDLHTPALRLASEILEREIRAEDLREWDFSPLFPNAAMHDAFWHKIGSRNFHRELRPYPGAAEGLALLDEIGAEVWFVTSPLSQGPTWAHDRDGWVAEMFPSAYLKHTHGKPMRGLRRPIIHTQDKQAFSGDFLVDDKPTNVLEWQRAQRAWLRSRAVGIVREPTGVLWSQPWNTLATVGGLGEQLPPHDPARPDEQLLLASEWGHVEHMIIDLHNRLIGALL